MLVTMVCLFVCVVCLLFVCLLYACLFWGGVLRLKIHERALPMTVGPRSQNFSISLRHIHASLISRSTLLSRTLTFAARLISRLSEIAQR